MTNDQYARNIEQARASIWKIRTRAQQQLNAVYEQAAEQAGKMLVDAQIRGLSDLTTAMWAQYQAQLTRIAQSIGDALDAGIRKSIVDGHAQYSAVDVQYITDVAAAAALDEVNRAVLVNMYASVDQRLIASMVTRIYQDGYSYSTRVWGTFDAAGRTIGVVGDWMTAIKNTVSAGFAQGRDVFEVARDIQQYTRDGKVALMNRYGGLVRGTREFARRIPKNIDWRSVRLARSELYSSLQEVGRIDGQMNPGASGLWDWFMRSAGGHTCICPELQRNSPYNLHDIPSYPHPNCLCEVRARLRPLRDVIDELRRYANGEVVPNIDAWYKTYYQPIAVQA